MQRNDSGARRLPFCLGLAAALAVVVAACGDDGGIIRSVDVVTRSGDFRG